MKIDTEHRPIFIVGSPRSGTTLTQKLIDAHPNIACGPETHFLKDLQKIVTSHWPRICKYDFEKEYWNQKFLASFIHSNLNMQRKGTRNGGVKRHLCMLTILISYMNCIRTFKLCILFVMVEM